ncbi:MAG: Polysaccharide biosynthesis protein CapD, partial [Bryobacterales bacterium]|nr:Polysaccharide biosynthesis protein CapD [Bryobacterales bacterium]
AGEKLDEAINSDDEETLPTYHEKIRVFARNGLREKSMPAHLGTLQGLCRSRDLSGLLSALQELVPRYDASQEVRRRSLTCGAARTLAAWE